MEKRKWDNGWKWIGEREIAWVKTVEIFVTVTVFDLIIELMKLNSKNYYYYKLKLIDRNTPGSHLICSNSCKKIETSIAFNVIAIDAVAFDSPAAAN